MMLLSRVALPLLLGVWCTAPQAQVEPLGAKSYGPQVFNGSPADLHTTTYMVALLREGLDFPGGFLCGATVVADGWVLTAAHCLYDGDCKSRKYTTIYAISGRARLSPGLPKLNATAVVTHPEFQCVPVDQQIAAVQSGKPIPMGNDIGLVRVAGVSRPHPALLLPSNNVAVTAMSPFVALGWGTLGNVRAPSMMLMSVDLTAVPRNSCVEAWAPSVISNDQLCVGPPKQGPMGGVCSGDSGGPLLGTLDSQRVQAGIVSLGHLVCTNVDRPSLFTSVLAHRAWIENHIGHNNLPAAPATGCTAADIAAGRC